MNAKQIVGPHGSSNTRIKGSDKKGQQFIIENINAHDLRSQIIVPDSNEGPAYFAPFYVFGKIGHEKQHEHGKQKVGAVGLHDEATHAGSRDRKTVEMSSKIPTMKEIPMDEVLGS